MAVAAETTKWSRRRRLTWARVGRSSVPYLLILPVVAALGAILGYPIYSLVRLSLQHYTLFELIRHQGQWVGLKNFSSVLHDQVFWHTRAPDGDLHGRERRPHDRRRHADRAPARARQRLGAHPRHLRPRARLGDARRSSPSRSGTG